MIMHETNNGLLDQAPLPRRLDLNLLVVFEAVWQERHVARAAARLALSQPATSHALARLRRIVGGPALRNARRAACGPPCAPRRCGLRWTPH